MADTKQNSPMIKIATFIVDRRNLFFLLFGIAIIFSVIASKWVKVENSLAAFLPKSAETSIALDRMEEEFTTYGSADIMISNITYDDALALKEQIEAIMSGSNSKP